MASKIQPCLLKYASHKRKRTEKTVRFDDEHIVIIDTYSSVDYDRGSIFAFPIQYKVNPAILSNSVPINDLEIPDSPTDSETSNSDFEILNMSTDNKRKRPKLTINTSLCADGPLFFTNLSTNHIKHRIGNSQHEEEYDAGDYLVPITPSSTIHSAFTF